jgi:glycosyltransferase involved in cell wall biosynthesis
MQMSSGSPAVTVVVAAYNEPSLLVTRAVPSVCRQTYDDWELVIVDDASTEDIGAAVAPWLSDPRIRLVRRPVNGGPSAARNTGIREARGRFICFLDHDDQYIGNKLAHQVKQLESAPDDVAGVAGAWFYPRRPVDGQLRGKVTELRREQVLGLDVWSMHLGTLLLRCDAVAEIGFDETLPVVQDQDLYIRLLERHRLLRDDVPVLVFHEDADERASSDRWNWVRDHERIYEKYLPEISQDRRLNAKWHAKVAYDALRYGYPTRARQHAAASIRLTPHDPRQWYLLAAAVVGNAPRRWLFVGYRRLGSLRRRLRSRPRERARDMTSGR